MVIPQSTIGLTGRAGLDLLTMLILIGWLYRPQKSLPSMPLILSSLNVGIFCAVSAFTAAPANLISQSIGFGLFALLSMLRLRSAAFTVKDVAFTFLSLIVGLINALPGINWILILCLDLGIVLVVAFTDTTRETRNTRVMRLTLERAYSDPVEVRAVLQERLGLQIESVIIREIDFVRETTDLRLSYVVDERWGKAMSEEMFDQPGGLYRP